jgi:pyruvate ferredoxin oxidoreductase gamma subunit
MKTASRLLGTAFFLAGYEVQDAPRYGAERRGAPIFAYVRAAKREVYERGVINRPDLVIVADDTLVPIPAAGVLAGMDGHTVLLINSHETAEIWRHRLNLAGPVMILPTPEEVEDRAELKFIGAACAGAAAQLVGVIPRETLEQAIRDEMGRLGATIVEKNLQKALAAYEFMAGQRGMVKATPDRPAEQWQHPGWIDLPFEDARISAPVIHAADTSEAMKTGLWRTMRPVVDYEHCNRCWWVCSTFCPDGAIKVKEDSYPDIDYDHCKGCLICVAQCPPHAIRAVAENLAAEQEPEGGSL